MAFNAVPGFKVEFDLVRIRDVWNALVNNRDLKGIRAMPMPGGRAFLPYDFTDGVGMSPYQAMTLAKLPYGKALTTPTGTMRRSSMRPLIRTSSRSLARACTFA